MAYCAADTVSEVRQYLGMVKSFWIIGGRICEGAPQTYEMQDCRCS
jgi:hypothetical protein